MPLRPLLRHWLFALAAVSMLTGAARADGIVGSSFPSDFPVIHDASLGMPLIGFGAAGPVRRTPVIFVHGNNDTPYPTPCNPFGKMQAFAQYFADHGYAASELWGLGYQGDQCDLAGDATLRSGVAHTAAANVDDLRRFVRAVLAYTGARSVDIVGHSLGVIVAREWIRQDGAARRDLRRLVAIDGPNQGIINCSPSPLNYWQAATLGGFTPDSAVCQELGSPDTPFLQRLNHESDEADDDDRASAQRRSDGRVTPRAAHSLVIRNADTSFVYFPLQDGAFGPVPAEDAFGKPTDFSGSARLPGAHELSLTGQGAYDAILSTAHLGIVNSPDAWKAALTFLSMPSPHR